MIIPGEKRAALRKVTGMTAHILVIDTRYHLEYLGPNLTLLE